MAQALVSILIPAYNAQRWLRASLLSALAQQGCRTEIIVVDDGSTDATLQIADSLASAGVRVASQPNAGASAARNHALSLAQGDYIQWLDADDLLSPGKIAAQLRQAERAPDRNSLLLSGFSEFYLDPARSRCVPNALWQDAAPVDVLLRKLSLNLWWFPAAWLVSRGLSERAGPWNERLSLDDDGEYFSRVVAASAAVSFCPEGQAYYRRGHSGSLSRDASHKASESLLASLALCFQHLLSLEDSERTRAACITCLQTWTDRSGHFHPDRGDLLQRVQRLAASLGGEVTPPTLSWKYRPVKSLLGWRATRQLTSWTSDMKLNARLGLESLRLASTRPAAGRPDTLSGSHPQ